MICIWQIEKQQPYLRQHLILTGTVNFWVFFFSSLLQCHPDDPLDSEMIGMKTWLHFKLQTGCIPMQSSRKLQDCLTKLTNFQSVLQKISVCLTNVLWFLAKRDSNLITDKPPVLQKFILSCQKFQSVSQLSCICWKDFAKTAHVKFY